MLTDSTIREDVEAELEWDPRFDSRPIGVAVLNGVVTLTGQVTSYAQRLAAEEAARWVRGVRAIANDINVQLAFDARRSDADIAAAVLVALDNHAFVPGGTIQPLVREGWVTLEGSVGSWHEKAAAEAAVRDLRGVKGLTNSIQVHPPATAPDVKARLEQAFRRRAYLDASAIRVRTVGSTVTLEGDVHSWYERELAESAARAAPGVARVIDNLHVRP